MELRITDFETVNQLNEYVETHLKGAKLHYDMQTDELIIRTGVMMTKDGLLTTAR